MASFANLCQDDSLDRDSRVKQVQGLLDTDSLDPGKKDDKGWYPLHYAALYGRPEITKLLLPLCDLHAEVTKGKNHRSTALHLACANGRLDVVEALLEHYHRGTSTREDREGNTPLHLACRFGSLEIVRLLLSKYDSKSITEANGKGITPFGFALSGDHYILARHLMTLSLGNPAQKFPDFRQHFPSLSKEQSLDHPVSIFVIGNRITGKSTLIKSLQVEGAWNRTKGKFFSTEGVDNHGGGIVPSDVSSYGYGRVKFYELASCRETTHEGVFQPLGNPANSLFVITLSSKDDMNKMEASLLFWLSFIRYQIGSGTVKPNIIVVASFLSFRRITGALRLDSFTRLRIIYNRVTSNHKELCNHFTFCGKFSMDCRMGGSSGMQQLRNMLQRVCSKMRPEGEMMYKVPATFCLMSFKKWGRQDARYQS